MKDVVLRLCAKNTVDGCAAADRLLALSEQSNEVYSYIDDFFALLDSDNSYVRTRAISLICANAKWDKQCKIDAAFDRLLLHITDRKPICARQFIKRLPQLAAAKPKLAKAVIDALESADVSFYAESMRGLVEGDIKKTVSEIKSL